ncbi:hypothetical protein KCP73_22385 [Salmonella enterica subsp. enterica]|nr:hypothetical protein KCP73_22385 [Salmonella enterica subsp. enterica]
MIWSGPKDEVSAALDYRVMSDEIVLPDGVAFYLHPGELALAVTLESVTLPPDLVGLPITPSLARLGLTACDGAPYRSRLVGLCIVSEFCTSGKLPLALRSGYSSSPVLSRCQSAALLAL